MNISYIKLGQPITAQQAIIANDFHKVYSLPDGSIKRVEWILDGDIRKVDYYKDDSETVESVKTLLTPLNCGFRIIERTAFGSSMINNANAYFDGELVKKFRDLKGPENYFSCFQELDLLSNEPILEETFKTICTDEDDESVSYCKFHYNNDGSLHYCEFNYMNDYDSEEFNQNNINLIIDKFILSDDMYNYFLTADFFPPV